MRETEKKSSKSESGKFVYAILIAVIPIIVYLLSFSSVIYNKGFIEQNMRKAGLMGYALEMNSHVVDYLMDKDEEKFVDLEIFDEKEKSHLLDVKILVHRIFDFLFVLLVLFFLLVYFNNKLNKGKNWGKILIYSGMASVLLPIILYFIPFNAVFNVFHGIFFAPGSWVFPSNSALIQMYPFDFWYNSSFGLFLRGFLTGWLLIALGFIVEKAR